jgi:aerobic carbon-monoxide dehydrogenase large subunit
MSTTVVRNGIGESQRRMEDFRFLTGKGNYIDDMNLPNQAYAMVLRSPEAHADIKSIDASEALALDGVLAVITGEEWKAAGYGPIRLPLTGSAMSGSRLR